MKECDIRYIREREHRIRVIDHLIESLSEERIQALREIKITEEIDQMDREREKDNKL